MPVSVSPAFSSFPPSPPIPTLPYRSARVRRQPCRPSVHISAWLLSSHMLDLLCPHCPGSRNTRPCSHMFPGLGNSQMGRDCRGSFGPAWSRPRPTSCQPCCRLANQRLIPLGARLSFVPFSENRCDLVWRSVVFPGRPFAAQCAFTPNLGRRRCGETTADGRIKTFLQIGRAGPIC